MIADKERAAAQKNALIDSYIKQNDLVEEIDSLSGDDMLEYREKIFREVFMSKGSFCGGEFLSLGRGKVKRYVDPVKKQFGNSFCLG
jgi:hypothetical protein